MAAYICSPCTVGWPNAQKFTKCPLCGGKTTYNYIKAPDYTAEEVDEFVRERLWMCSARTRPRMRVPTTTGTSL